MTFVNLLQLADTGSSTGSSIIILFCDLRHPSSIFYTIKVLGGSERLLILWKKLMPEQYVYIVAGEKPFSKQLDMKYWTCMTANPFVYSNVHNNFYVFCL